MAHGQRWFLTRCGVLAALFIVIVGAAVGFTRLLPGGGIIAYTFDTDGSTDIFVLDVSRPYHLNLSHTPTLIESRPTWSSDGMRLAYERGGQGTNQLCILQIGHTNRCFSPHEFFDNSPVWSPDGQWLAFNSAGAAGGNLFLRDTTSGEVRRLNLITTEVRRAYSWSPDSTRIAFSEYQPDGFVTLSIVNLSTGELVRRIPGERARDMLPYWSPDGQRIALISDTGAGYKVYVVNTNDYSPTQPLTSEPGYDLSLSWSPDSSRLLLVSTRNDDDFELYLIDPDTGDMLPLTNNIALDERPTWSPDGRQIAFTSDRDGDVHIYVMNADGSEVRRLTFAEGRNTDPAWRP